MATWQVQEAKSRFSEVLEEAEHSGPQIITRHGTEKAVILSIEDYRALKGRKKQFDFKEHLLSGPFVDEFDIPLQRDTGRKIRL